MRAALVAVVLVACGGGGGGGSGSGSGSGSGRVVAATPFTDKALEKLDLDSQDLERSVTVMPHADFVRKAIEVLGSHGGLQKGCGKLVSAYSGAGVEQQDKFVADVAAKCNFACRTEDGCGAPDSFGGAKLRGPDRIVLEGALDLTRRALAEQNTKQATAVLERLVNTVAQLGLPETEDKEPPAPTEAPKPNTARLSEVAVPADKGRIRAKIYAGYRGDLEGCAVKAKFSGKMLAHLAMDGDGKVVHAHFDEASETAKCIEPLAEKWQFTKGGPAIADVSFVLTYTP